MCVFPKSTRRGEEKTQLCKKKSPSNETQLMYFIQFGTVRNPAYFIRYIYLTHHCCSVKKVNMYAHIHTYLQNQNLAAFKM